MNTDKTRTLHVTTRSVYGNETVYPSCETAKALCRLTGRKTFTHADIRTLQEIGYSFTNHAPLSPTAALLASNGTLLSADASKALQS